MRKAKTKQVLSNKTSLKEDSRKIKKVYLGYAQLTKQRGLCDYSGVFLLSHRVISELCKHIFLDSLIKAYLINPLLYFDAHCIYTTIWLICV